MCWLRALVMLVTPVFFGCVNSNTTQCSGGAICQAGFVCTADETGCIAPPRCPSQTTDCAPTAPMPVCVNVETSTAHCGACGHQCAAGQTCAAGVCTGGSTMCPTGQTNCAPAGMPMRCVNPLTDVAHCGMCGRACPMGQACSAGTCMVSCVTGTTTEAFSVLGTILYARLGTAVSSAGDVNGDGYADVLAASHGSARVFQGSGAGVVTAPYWENLGVSADRYGDTASGAGDIDRNGLSDVLVGAMFADPGGRTNAGTVSVYLFSGTPMPTTVTLEGVVANDILGRSVASRRVRSPFVCMCTQAESVSRRLASPAKG